MIKFLALSGISTGLCFELLSAESEAEKSVRCQRVEGGFIGAGSSGRVFEVLDTKLNQKYLAHWISGYKIHV